LTYGIVLPFENHSQYLPQALKSLETQTGPILLIDNHSHDGSRELALAFAAERENVSLVENTPAVCPGENWNIGLRQLQTEFVLLLKPSVVIRQKAIDRLVAELTAHPEVASAAPRLVMANGLVMHTGGLWMRGLPVWADQRQPVSDLHSVRTYDYDFLDDTCLLIRRTALFRTDFKEFAIHDWCEQARLDGQVHRYIGEVDAMTQEEGRVEADHYEQGTFVVSLGGLDATDKRNNAGSYYGGLPGQCDFPSTEIWTNQTSKGRIACFLADHDGCGNYRMKNPYRGMILRGWDVMFTTYAPDEFIAWPDVIVVQRACADHMLDVAAKAKALGKKIIYEIDDLFHALHPSNPVTPSFAEHPEWLRNMEKLIYQADALTVSTPELLRQYGRFNSNAHIVPNFIDLGLIPQPILENHTGKIRIGWGGSATHNHDMLEIVGAVTKVMAIYPNTQLIFMGTDYRGYFPQVAADRMEWFPPTWGHEDVTGDYYKIINQARLDIALAPISNTTFNKAKSSIKILEAMAWGIVPVASDVEPYHLELHQTKMGFLAKNERDWIKYLSRLIEDPELRLEMGKAGQAYVWNQRGVTHMTDIVEGIVQDLLLGKGHVPKKAEPVHSLPVSYMNHLTSKQLHERQYVLQPAA
jgi:glycosyltransferase involved in cell wall biosynthesis